MCLPSVEREVGWYVSAINALEASADVRLSRKLIAPRANNLWCESLTSRETNSHSPICQRHNEEDNETAKRASELLRNLHEGYWPLVLGKIWVSTDYLTSFTLSLGHRKQFEEELFFIQLRLTDISLSTVLSFSLIVCGSCVSSHQPAIPTLIHQFYFGLSFALIHTRKASPPKSFACASFSLCVCVCASILFFPLRLSTLFRFCSLAALCFARFCVFFFPHSQCFHYNIFQFIL